MPTQSQTPPMAPHQRAAVDACRDELQKAGGLSPAAIQAIIQAILTVVQTFVPQSTAPPKP